jgi:ABC-2 type transport system ATP-binding protein
LVKIPNIQKVEAVNNAWLIETSADIDLRKEISQFAQKEKWLILTLKIEKKSLEEVFKDLTK